MINFDFQEIIPIINWETETFSPPVLTILVFASVALFPTILLPSTPSMWVAGMKYGYGFGFLLIVPAVAIGVSLPFIIGSIFHHKIEVCPVPLRDSICCFFASSALIWI